jgi:UDP-N-acetyl-D-mannosaminuronate dehydrogenase
MSSVKKLLPTLGLYAGGQCCSVQPGLLKPNKITKVEDTFIDAAKQVEPNMPLGYVLKMKDAFRLAHLHKTICYAVVFGLIV